MKKCTLCVDRIYNETLRRSRTRAGLRRRPARPARGISATSAIPNSTVSKLVAERGGFDLMPELGYAPDQQVPAAAPAPAERRLRRRAAPALAPAAPAPQAAGLAVPAGIDRVLGRTEPMHPALSVIIFTTASGAGYGLLACSACWRRSASLPDRPAASASAALALALGAITRRPAGLDLPSRPARARLAGLLAMAHVLAVARRRRGGRDLPAGRPVRASSGSSSAGSR